MHDDRTTAIDATDLQPGVRLRTPLYDERGVLLLAAGQIVTEAFLAILRRRGTQRLRVDGSGTGAVRSGTSLAGGEFPPPHARVRCTEANEWTASLDALVSDRDNVRLPPQEQAFHAVLANHGSGGVEEAHREEFSTRRRAAGRKLHDSFNRFVQGDGFEVGQLAAIADEALADLRDDPDLFASLGLDPFVDGYPAQHSLQTAMLSLAVATHLHVDRATLRELAIGCLIHDAGMLLIDRASYEVRRGVSRIEFLEITKHPVRIFDRTRVLASLPSRSALVAYQMHERCDGTGYPRGRLAGHIHLLSKVSAVADVYTALASPRPHRGSVLPHVALRAVVREAVRGRLDAVATLALLRTLSAYPLGSYVELSDGRVGRVVRSNGGEFERPVVEVRRRDEPHTHPAVVDLSANVDLRIEGAISSLDAAADEVRTDDTSGIRFLVEQLEWAVDDVRALESRGDAATTVVGITYPDRFRMETIVRPN